MRELSCLYQTCIDGSEEEECDNIRHALPQKTIKLVPTKKATRELMDDYNFEFAWGVDGQQLADFICQGENFAIHAHDPSSDEQYFLFSM